MTEEAKKETEADYVQDAYADGLTTLVNVLIGSDAASTPEVEARFRTGLDAKRKALKAALEIAKPAQPAAASKSDEDIIREACGKAISPLFQLLAEDYTQASPDPDSNYKTQLAIIRKAQDQAITWTKDHPLPAPPRPQE